MNAKWTWPVVSLLVSLWCRVGCAQEAVAAGDDYSVEKDNVLSIAAPGVLGNDTDATGAALTTRRGQAGV